MTVLSYLLPYLSDHMKGNILFKTDISVEEAKKLQEELAKKVKVIPLEKPIKRVAGVDVCIKENRGIACIVVMSYPNMKILDISIEIMEISFPYIPGLLGFREGPVIIEAIKKLTLMPDVFIFDGQGIAHPRKMGIATHIGVVIDVPTIGCAKSVLCGTYKEPKEEKGSWSPLMYRGKVIGAALRTRKSVKPVIVSVGHKIELSQCIDIVLKFCTRYRLPEPIRQAHIIAGKEMKRIESAL